MKTKIIRLIVVIAAIALIGAAVVYLFKNQGFGLFDKKSEIKVGEKTNEKTSAKDIEIVAQGLNVPWEIAFLPSGEILVTERPGTIKKIGKDGAVFPIEGVEHIGEGGLLGLALHPRFSENYWIYLYLTTKTENGLVNRVERYRLENNQLFDRTVIIDNIPGAAYHDGGRIVFGKEFRPHWYLFITTGDADQSELAQNVNSLAGKILRIWDDGSIPDDNPFGNAVFSYGHRNPQGLAWDNEGRLWATEHGRSGVLSGLDELNLIEMGKNYGWPIIQGDEMNEGMQRPIIHSGPDKTWAPAGAVFYNGSIFFTGLRGESLYQVKISKDGKIGSLSNHFQGEFGRLRAIQIGPDGFFYVSTSNTDGRGQVRSGDDKIIKINSRVFEKN